MANHHRAIPLKDVRLPIRAFSARIERALRGTASPGNPTWCKPPDARWPGRPLTRRRSPAVFRLAASIPVAYLAVIRPWHLGWGSTSEERSAPLPGDELIPRPAAEPAWYSDLAWMAPLSPAAAVEFLLLEVPHIVMERKQVLGIKARAERLSAQANARRGLARTTRSGAVLTPTQAGQQRHGLPVPLNVTVTEVLTPWTQGCPIEWEERPVTTTPELAGANCATSGTKIEAGIDANGNGTLEPGESAAIWGIRQVSALWNTTRRHKK